MLHHLRRVGSVVAVALVTMGLVVFDPNGPHAVANSGASLAGPNAWIVADFAAQAAQMGTSTNINTQPVGMLANDVRSAPTAALSATAGRSKGFSLRGLGGWKGALLTLGGAVALDLALAGDGAPDPGGILPAASPSVPGWANGGTLTTQTGGTVWTGTFQPVGLAYLGSVAGTAMQPSPAAPAWGQLLIEVWCVPKLAGGALGQPLSVGSYGANPRGGSPISFDSLTSSCNGTSRGFDHVLVKSSADGLVKDSWWPEGHVSRPAAAPGPDEQPHTAVNRVECIGPSGDSVFVESTVTFTLGALRAGLPVTIPEVQCPADYWGAQASQDVRTDVGGTVTTTPLSSGAVTGALADRAAGLLDGTDTGLQLESDGQPCVVGESRCRGWTLDPEKDTRYQCKDNGVVVHLSRCLVYEDAFKAEGGMLGDPSGDTAGTPVDADSDACWPQGWGRLNPAEWVYRPIRCALEWAFVPTRSDTSLSSIRTAVDGTAPVVWSAAVAGMFDQVPAAGGCEGPALHFEAFGLVVDSHPFSACAEPMATAATWTRNIATVLLMVFGPMACVRALGSGFGWKPSAGGDA